MSVVKDLQVAGLAQYLRRVQQTSRVSVIRASEGSALATFWHEAVFALLAAMVGTKNVAVYVRDQPFPDNTLALLVHLGVTTFVSDHRGTAGVKAARQWLSVPGRLLLVTADFMKPRVALPGVARLARMLGVPLCPMVVTASHGYRMPVWDRCVVPHLRGELSVQVLPPVAEPSLAATAASVGRDLSPSTLTEPSAAPLLPWRRALEAWPRLCLMRRTRGKLAVWPATQSIEVNF